MQTDLNHSALPDEGAEGARPLAHGSASDAAGPGERASTEAIPPEVDADLLPDRHGTGVEALARDEDSEDDAASDLHERGSQMRKGPNLFSEVRAWYLVPPPETKPTLQIFDF